MSTTTQILFNSPALHSLKHDQLQKLCKIHSLKANGKKTELIEKLKQHSKTLPKDDPLSIAARSEEDDEDEEELEPEVDPRTMCRESQQWEVMESIKEVDETSSRGSTLNSQRTISGHAGEFGTGSHKSTGTVGSSIRALASSLGLKRSMTSKSGIGTSASLSPIKAAASLPDIPDELTQNSVPYSSLPPAPAGALPSTDHFVLSTPDSPPLPGHALRPGVQAPDDARLSLSALPSTPSKPITNATTIRLVSNATNKALGENFFGTPQLRPFATSFDLDLGSPSGGGMTVWPQPQLYPSLVDDKDDKESSTKEAPQEEQADDMDVDMPGGFGSPRPMKPLPARASLAPQPVPDAFVFGVPVQQQASPRFSFASPTTTKLSVLEEMNQRLAAQGVEGITTTIFDQPKCIDDIPRQRTDSTTYARFDKAHHDAFSKMESIQSWADRRKSPDKSLNAKKRKSSVMDDGVGGGRAPKKVALPPPQVHDKDKVEDGERRMSKKPRMSMERRDALSPDEEERTTKEREAIRRTLQKNKERRRSSMHNRASIAPPPPKPKSRFGFLSSAKSLVQNVWNRGGNNNNNNTKAPTSTKTTTSKLPSSSKPTTSTMGRPPAKTSTARPSTSRPPSMGMSSRQSGLAGTAHAQAQPRAGSTTASRARSPLPFGTGTNSNTNTGASTSTSKASSGPSSRVSSLGTKISTSSNLSRVSSLGTRGMLGAAGKSDSAGKRTSNMGSGGGMGTTDSNNKSQSQKRFSAGSRLLAPTASSLAKMHPHPQASSHPHNGDSSIASRSGVGVASSSSSTSTSKPTGPNGKVDQEGRKQGQGQGQGQALEPITNANGNGSPSKIPIFLRSPLGAAAAAAGAGARAKLNRAKEAVDNTTMTTMTLGLDLDLSIFPKPPTKAPAPVLNRPTAGAGAGGAGRPIRKPRISRSKVIAKLASQRDASGSSSNGIGGGAGSGLGVGATSAAKLRVRRSSGGGGGKTRSSLGVGIAGTKKGALRGSDAGDRVMQSAKKRAARQSEYLRRRSAAAVRAGVSGAGDMSMSVDG